MAPKNTPGPDASILETVPNRHPDRDYEVAITCPEFTTLCPKTGQPDFATIAILYVPDRLIVELKSLKLYLHGYRDVGIFHEAATNQILDDFVAACRPRRCEVTGDFNVRGGIKTVVKASHEATPARPGGGAATGAGLDPRVKP